jgi:hypothetical protein
MISIYDIINIILLVILVYEFKIFINNDNIEKKTNTELPQTSWDNFKHWLVKSTLDYRYRQAVKDPLTPPDRSVEGRQLPLPNYYFQERTRGDPDDYQMVGLLYNTNINKNYQLYGRRIYPGAYEWEYYILGRDAGGLEYKYPLDLNNNAELLDGTTINIPIDSNLYNVSIYKYDYYRYNPYPNFK